MSGGGSSCLEDDELGAMSGGGSSFLEDDELGASATTIPPTKHESLQAYGHKGHVVRSKETLQEHNVREEELEATVHTVEDPAGWGEFARAEAEAVSGGTAVESDAAAGDECEGINADAAGEAALLSTDV